MKPVLEHFYLFIYSLVVEYLACVYADRKVIYLSAVFILPH